MVDGANAFSPYLQHGMSSSILSPNQARPTPSPSRAETDVALLIDWENLKLSLRDIDSRTAFGTANPLQS
jgi:hypothetical protein